MSKFSKKYNRSFLNESTGDVYVFSSFKINAAKFIQTQKSSQKLSRGQNKHPLLKVDAKTNSFGAQTQRNARARKQRVTRRISRRDDSTN